MAFRIIIVLSIYPSQTKETGLGLKEGQSIIPFSFHRQILICHNTSEPDYVLQSNTTKRPVMYMEALMDCLVMHDMKSTLF